jgi:hypothetical protein
MVYKGNMMGVIMRNDEMRTIGVCEFRSQPEDVRFQNSQTAFQQRLEYQIFDAGSTFHWQ